MYAICVYLARSACEQLKDIGLTAADVYKERTKPFWR
jgi:uncharacterized protein YjiS (DUF1127 family)